MITMTDDFEAAMVDIARRPGDAGSTASQYTDVLTVRRAQDGDTGAFEAIYRQRVARIGRYVGAIVRDPTRTEDAVSETFLQAWRDLRALRDPQRFDAWLYRIAHRRALAEVRRTRPTLPIEEAAAVPDERGASEPQSALDGRLAAAEVRAALLQIKESYREVLVLRHFGGLSHREIAVQLGKSDEAVRAMYSRGARQLRGVLEARQGVPQA